MPADSTKSVILSSWQICFVWWSRISGTMGTALGSFELAMISRTCSSVMMVQRSASLVLSACSDRMKILEASWAFTGKLSSSWREPSFPATCWTRILANLPVRLCSIAKHSSRSSVDCGDRMTTVEPACVVRSSSSRITPPTWSFQPSTRIFSFPAGTIDGDPCGTFGPEGAGGTGGAIGSLVGAMSVLSSATRTSSSPGARTYSALGQSLQPAPLATPTRMLEG
mmetsp:Transcript_126158/g.351538  ORF Transcript_126158/g.351538 Transcript_126158/m.351538 type:complete len:225 (-) Transcript_126158:495-1169(-)